MVHQYKNNGYNIVLDVNSGVIHVVDRIDEIKEKYVDNMVEHVVSDIKKKLE